MDQNILRRQTKLAKALNNDYSYKDFAGALDITEHSFYNWIAGYYNLSHKKAMQLEDIVINLID